MTETTTEQAPSANASVPEKVKKGIVQEFAAEKHKGNFVEQKWMNAYERVVNALDEGKRKQATEMLRPVAVAVAKANKIGAGVVDFVWRIRGVLEVGAGLLNVAAPGIAVGLGQRGAEMLREQGRSVPDVMNMTTGDVRRHGVRIAARGAFHEAVGATSGVQFASGFMADITGAGLEKVAQIENKILRKFSKPAPMPVKA